ncbi:hypothetical protein F442_13113 [Phytophthora nicotianae P10297]|uniref:Uncharacterized protein n=1 Tax=Phytophthora nicotianae P10297 TaxID=1317064 RepID=W2YZM9_PHYNI|nr:hypothetical protein F442_13113 [Phytophthora nicotianae P10297]
MAVTPAENQSGGKSGARAASNARLLSHFPVFFYSPSPQLAKATRWACHLQASPG